MTWARLDDRYDDHIKVKKAWREHPRAIGLHAMAITYCARNETDGHVDIYWLEEKLPAKRERDQAVQALVDAGLFVKNGTGYIVHDYLEYNPSREDLAAKRRADSERKAKGRANRVR